jgi:hypothetical protein
MPETDARRGVQMSAVRAQGGREREAMRSFPPLAPDHPSVGAECAVCGEEIAVGATLTVIPLGPGADEDAQRKAVDGRWYSCLGVIAHDDCAGVMTNAPGDDRG